MLCTQTDVEQLLQIDFGSDPDPVVATLIAQSSAIIEAHLQRPVLKATVIEVFDADGRTSILRVTTPPVTGTPQVTEDGTVLVDGTDYFWYPNGAFYRTYATAGFDRWWKRGRQIVEIQYDGGYTTVPADIARACANMVARAFQAGAFALAEGVPLGARSLSLADQSVTLDDRVSNVTSPSLTSEEIMILAPYRRRVLV